MRPPRRSRPRLTDRGRAFIAAGVTLASAGIALGFTDLTRLGILVVALPVCAAVLTQASRPRLQVERSLSPGILAVGEPADVTLHVRSTGRRPSPDSLADEAVAPALEDGRRFHLPSVRPRAHLDVSYRLTPRRRGSHQVGPVTVHLSDPFGLAGLTTPVPGVATVTVWPRRHPLAGRPTGTGGVGVEGASPHRLGVLNEDDATIRDYHVGDDLRRIHWPATAHRDTLMVRQESPPPLNRVTLLLDPTLPSSGPAAAQEWAVEALASVAAHLAGFRCRLQVVAAAPDAGVHVSRGDLDDALTTLALAPALATHRPAGAVEDPLLASAREVAAAGGLLVTVVGSHDPSRALDVLSTRPAGTVGLAVVLHLGRGDVDALVAQAAAGGWRAVAATPQAPVAAAWAAWCAGPVGSVGVR